MSMSFRSQHWTGHLRGFIYKSVEILYNPKETLLDLLNDHFQDSRKEYV